MLDIILDSDHFCVHHDGTDREPYVFMGRISKGTKM
eukprot:SAG31_NODE_1764_length_7320_cov_3.114112_2_plen_36_part_00